MCDIGSGDRGAGRLGAALRSSSIIDESLGTPTDEKREDRSDQQKMNLHHRSHTTYLNEQTVIENLPGTAVPNYDFGEALGMKCIVPSHESA